MYLSSRFKILLLLKKHNSYAIARQQSSVIVTRFLIYQICFSKIA